MNQNIWPISIWLIVTAAAALVAWRAPESVRRMLLTVVAVQAFSALMIFAAVGVVLVVTL